MKKYHDLEIVPNYSPLKSLINPNEKRKRGRPRKQIHAVLLGADVENNASDEAALKVNIESNQETEPQPQISTKLHTTWRNGVKPPNWVFGKYICEVCKIDCGYANNLEMHRKRSHICKL